MLSETQPPEIIQGQSVAKIEVPAEAANSVVGFENTLITVNEGMFFFQMNSVAKNIQLFRFAFDQNHKYNSHSCVPFL